MYFHSTSLGKILLAAAGSEKARMYLGAGPLPALTAHTITDPSVIIDALRQIRRDGYATVIEENLQGVISVAAPVRDHDGHVVAGLSVAFSKGAMNLQLETIAELAVSASDNISRSLGCPDEWSRRWAHE